MRIAIFIDSLAIGGAQKHVRQIACMLAHEGETVTVFVLNEILEKLYLDPLEAAGVRVELIGRAQVASGYGLIKTAVALWTHKVDAVLTVLFVSTIFGRIAAQIAGGIPVLTCLQARNIDYCWWQKALLRSTASITVFTISNSRSALSWASEHEGVNLRQSAFIPNAIDPPPVIKEMPTWTEIGLPLLEKRRVIGSLGRLAWQKGYDVLLDAMSSLTPDLRRDVAVVVFGEGPERTALAAKTQALGLDKVVFFPGQRADAIELLPKFDLYVQPSRFEGTPNAVLEALVSKLPVIATAVDGVAELSHLLSFENVCRPDDPVTLAANIGRWIKENTTGERELIADRELGEFYIAGRTMVSLLQLNFAVAQRRVRCECL